MTKHSSHASAGQTTDPATGGWAAQCRAATPKRCTTHRSTGDTWTRVWSRRRDECATIGCKPAHQNIQRILQCNDAFPVGISSDLAPTASCPGYNAALQYKTWRIYPAGPTCQSERFTPKRIALIGEGVA